MTRTCLVACVATIAALSSTGALAAKDPVPGCVAAKLKAAGKKAQAKLNCHAKAVKKGVAVDAACLAKAEAAFAKAFANAEKKTDCAGEPGIVEDQADAFVSAAVIDVTAKRVFVSSATFAGDLGGLAGADAKCQDLATAAGLFGSYKAWLSTTTTNAADRFNQSTIPYVLVDGTKISKDFDNLTDDDIDHGIDRTEGGVLASGVAVWTATNPDGTYDQAGDCNAWTSASHGNVAFEGLSDRTDSAWTEATDQFCDFNFLHLYCFEQ